MKCLHMSIKLLGRFEMQPNETACEQNLFSGRFEISNRYEFFSPLMWTYSNFLKINCKLV